MLEAFSISQLPPLNCLSVIDKTMLTPLITGPAPTRASNVVIGIDGCAIEPCSYSSSPIEMLDERPTAVNVHSQYQWKQYKA